MRSKERAKSLGEVFTPAFLVERILSHIPHDVITDITKTILDNACGDGNFLVEVMQQRRIGGATHLDAIKTIYGIDIDELNVTECRKRLIDGSRDKRVIDTVHHNIIQADALKKNYSSWDDKLDEFFVSEKMVA